MVDYSKWEHIGDSEEEDDYERPAPTVSKLGVGSRVTFGGGKVTIETPKEDEHGGSGCENKEEQQRRAKAKEAEEMAKRRKAEMTRNGGEEPTHRWSQTRDEASIHVFAPKHARAKDVRVEVTTPRGVGVKQRVRVTIAPSVTPIVDSEIAYPIDGSDDAIDGCYSLEDVDAERRAVRVEFRKVAPAEGVVIWWRRALVGDAEIPHESIVDADMSERAVESRRKWEQTWRDAHEAFRQRVAAQQPTVIDDGGEEDDSAAVAGDGKSRL